MSFLAWMALVGGLLLLMALSSSYLTQIPVSTSFIYLMIGIAVSPAMFGVAAIDLEANAVFFEHLTEIAVIISLFVGGFKLRLPLKNKAWSAAFRLGVSRDDFFDCGRRDFRSLCVRIRLGNRNSARRTARSDRSGSRLDGFG